MQSVGLKKLRLNWRCCAFGVIVWLVLRFWLKPQSRNKFYLALVGEESVAVCAPSSRGTPFEGGSARMICLA